MAAGARDIKAGSAWVSLGLDRTAFIQGLKSAGASLKQWGASIRNIGAGITAAGASITAPLALAGKLFADAGAEINRFSKKTGLSVKSASELAFVSHEVGLEVDDLAKGFRFMQKTIDGAANKSKTATAELKRLGLTIADLKDLSPDEQFTLIADRLGSIKDPAARATLAVGIFGRAGAGLLPLLLKGSAGINALREEGRRLGLVMTEEDVKAAVELKMANRLLFTSFAGLKNQLGAAVAPVLLKIAKYTTDAVVAAITWVRSNRDLVATIFTVAKTVTIAGGAIVGLGLAIQGIGFALGGFSKLILLAGSAVSAMAAVVGFVVSPLGLAILAVVGLGAAIEHATGAISGILGPFGTAMLGIRDVAVEAFGGIRDALLAGDIEAAGKIAFTGLQIVGQIALDALKNLWSDLKTTALNTATEMWAGVKSIWESGTAFIASLWDNVTTGLRNAWDGFTSIVLEGFQKILAGISAVLRGAGAVATFTRNAGAASAAFKGAREIDAFAQGFEQARSERDATAGQAIAGRNATSADTQAQIEADKQAAIARIRADADATATQRTKDQTDATVESTEKLKKLRGELDDLVAAAAAKRAAKAVDKDLADFFGPVEGAAKSAVAGARNISSTFGTFNVSSLLGLGGGQTGNETVDELRKANGNLESIDEKIRRLEMEWQT